MEVKEATITFIYANDYTSADISGFINDRIFNQSTFVHIVLRM